MYMINKTFKKQIITNLYEKQIYLNTQKNVWEIFKNGYMIDALINKISIFNNDRLVPVYKYKFTELDNFNLDITDIMEPLIFIINDITKMFLLIVKHKVFNVSDNEFLSRFLYDNDLPNYLNINMNFIIKNLNEYFYDITSSLEDFGTPELYQNFLENINNE